MPRKRTASSRASAALATVLMLMAATFTLASPATAANDGTIKVTQDASCTQESNANNPKVVSPFYIGGEGFSPAGMEFTLTIATQPGDVDAWTGTEAVDEQGSFCVGPISVPPGQYKVTMSSSDDKDKSKVFQVEVPAPVLVVPMAPSVTAPDCDTTGTLVVPPTTTEITYSVAPAYTTGATGDFTVTATANQGYVFADKQTVKVFAPLTVKPATGDCSIPPPAAVPAAVTPPTFTNATCAAPASMSIPADTAQIDYTTVGTATPGTTVTVTATAFGNVVLTGYPTGGWSHSFVAAATVCDDAVGGTEDTDTDTEESDSADDEVIADSEDELAATGGNVGPAGLGFLLILSGAAFVTARRLALR